MPFWLLFAAIAVLALAYYRPGIRATGAVLGVTVLCYGVFGESTLLLVLLALLWIAVFLPLSIPPLRQEWLSRPALAWFKRVVQRLDPATLAALDAGTAWWEAELIGGEPDWQRFQSFPPARPLPGEQGVVDDLVAGCRSRAGEPGEAAAWLRQQQAYGMGIPHRHGGLQWSAVAQSAALAGIAAIDPRLAERCAGPRRLAWIELLRRHGSEAQQSRWLPRLAAGAGLADPLDEVAGDAVAFSVVREGERVTLLRLRLDARFAAPARLGDEAAAQPELIGLLLRVRDPDRLLGGRQGLACLLLESGEARLAPGATALRAEGLVVGIDAVIGGGAHIGAGGADFAESLAVAHAIATSALHAGRVAAAAAGVGACARLHAPFSAPLGDRAVAQDALALVGARSLAAQAQASASALSVDLGERPQGLASCARSLAAEQGTQIRFAAATLGLDQGTLRPLLEALEPAPSAEQPARLARSTGYSASVLRGHRAFRHALAAVRTPNAAQALERFDTALWRHIGHIFSSGIRAFVLALTAGSFSAAAGHTDLVRGYCRRINRYSAALAFATDLALTGLGADLASRQPRTALRAMHAAARLTLTTWLGDAVAQLWLTSTALKHFEDEAAPDAERAALEWLCADALRAVEEALDLVLRHLSAPALSWLARLLIFPLGHAALAPGDAANRRVAQWLQDENRLRRRCAAAGPRLGPLAAALEATLAGEALEKSCGAAEDSGLPAELRIADVAAAGGINAPQARQLGEWLEAVRRLRLPV
jgi:acyl-CoA dehydrogenase